MAIEVDIALELAPEPASVRRGRHALERLSEVVPESKLDDARLVVSELITNELKHTSLSGEPILLQVTARRGLIEGEVCRRGGGFEPPEDPAPREDLAGGWGLYIIDNICDRWGVRRSESFCVWFEIRWKGRAPARHR